MPATPSGLCAQQISTTSSLYAGDTQPSLLLLLLLQMPRPDSDSHAHPKDVSWALQEPARWQALLEDKSAHTRVGGGQPGQCQCWHTAVLQRLASASCGCVCKGLLQLCSR